jgi:hypothetical protein
MESSRVRIEALQVAAGYGGLNYAMRRSTYEAHAAGGTSLRQLAVSFSTSVA